MIHLEGINKTYFNGAPLHVLKGIDLDIEKGEMVSVAMYPVSGSAFTRPYARSPAVEDETFLYSSF